MISLSVKNLISDKTKLVGSILGVAFSILVILAPFGVYFGSIYPSRALPEKSGAEFWVSQKGSEDLFHTVSILPSGFEEEFEKNENVISASSILIHPSRVKLGDEEVTAGIFGFDALEMIGAPWNMYEGTNKIEKNEAIIDRSLASLHKVDVGDIIKISNEEFKIKGISLDTNVLVFQYIFIRSDDAQRVFQQERTVNYYLLNVADASSESANELEGIISNSEIKTKERIADSNAKVIRDSFLPIIALIASIGILVGAVIISLTIYSLTVAKEKEYGVLKAIGVSSTKLYRVVFEQALIVSTLGYFIGLIFYIVIQKMSFYVLPQVIFSIPFYIYPLTFVTAIIMSLVSSYMPAKKINSLDPALVFKK